MDSFFEIFQRHGSNKSQDYAEAYEDAFGSIRNNIKLLFEIGIHRGASIRGWKEYFPNAHIVGIEINEYRKFEAERINIEIGNGTGRHFMERLVGKYGQPDILIDDGSHLSSQIRLSHEIMFPLTTFCYVIEDYGSQYPSWWNGSFIDDGRTAVDILHKHIDDVLSQYQHTENGPLKSILVHPSICFLYKKSKTEIII